MKLTFTRGRQRLTCKQMQLNRWILMVPIKLSEVSTLQFEVIPSVLTLRRSNSMLATRADRIHFRPLPTRVMSPMVIRHKCHDGIHVAEILVLNMLP
jgi:hypothetical protein